MPRNSLGFGDYRLLERLAKHGPQPRGEDTNWTMIDLGLAVRLDGMLTITRDGHEYLKRHKCPPFPASKPYKFAATFACGDGI